MRRQLCLLHGQLHQRDHERVVGLVRRDPRQLDRVGYRHRGRGAQLYRKWGNLGWDINKERVCIWYRDGGADLIQCCGGCEDEAVLDGSSISVGCLRCLRRPLCQCATPTGCGNS